ncbi:hypothetical protein A1OS_15420 [Enterovibrio norvegicus]|uniref:hypothetical protein n=1 Tax=Enterovibrio norvegicus TaxID=188144 RepID=UPI00030D28EA|nr:hypothetical protein [Enterovibrio norvegicus]OEE65019.1 hypothetical protein A1OS_15420 [Enterovibrio norvegicus]
MSKTLIYSFLMLKSSAKVREKVLARFNAEEKDLVMKELEVTPLYSADLLRSMQSAIVEESIKPALIHKLESKAPEEPQNNRSTLLDWVINSTWLSINDRDAASEYLDGLDSFALKTLIEYAELDNE